MKTKRLISMLILSIMVMQLSACKSESAKNLKSKIDSGSEISVAALAPTTYSINIVGTETPLQNAEIDTDKLKTHSESGFRIEFEKVFEINRISDKSYGDGLQGCLYTVKHEGEDVTNGKACLADAFRNKAFVEEFWEGNSTTVQNKLNELAEKEYSDISKTQSAALYASLNAYWNLFPDYQIDEKTIAFNGSAPLTREQFYAFAYRSQNTKPLEEVEFDPATDEFAIAVRLAPKTDENGNTVEPELATSYTRYAKEVDRYAWLGTSDKSLNGSTINRYITRAEAVYMLVMQNFPDLYAQTTDGATAYDDNVNNGDMATKLGFKDSKTGTELPGWRAYTLAYMVSNPDKGMQSELYRAFAVAKTLGLINDVKSRWEEAISRQEAIQLVIDCQLAANRQYGYNTTEKNGKIVALVELPKPEIPEDIMERINNLTDEQIKVFESIASMYQSELKTHKYTQEEVDRLRLKEFDRAAINGVIVTRISDLFPYWAYLNEYTDIYPTETLIGGKFAGENTTSDKSQNALQKDQITIGENEETEETEETNETEETEKIDENNLDNSTETENKTENN